MPKPSKPHGNKPPIGEVAAAATLTVADGPFGSLLPVTVTDVPPDCFVRAQAWLVDDPVKDDNSDVLDYWVDPGDPIQAGPTQSWSGGAATGRARLVQFTAVAGQDLIEEILEETTFNVTA